MNTVCPAYPPQLTILAKTSPTKDLALQLMIVARLPQIITMTSLHQAGVLLLPQMTKPLTDPSPTRVSTHDHLERSHRRTIPTTDVLRRSITTGDITMVNINNPYPRVPHIGMGAPPTVIQRQITTIPEEMRPGKDLKCYWSETLSLTFWLRTCIFKAQLHKPGYYRSNIKFCHLLNIRIV